MADISRADAIGLLATQKLSEILKDAEKVSLALTTLKQVRMAKGTMTQPVLETLPEAGWVSESATASNGVKPTSEVTWGSKVFVAAELAVIIPIHEDVIADADYDIEAEIFPLVSEAIGRKLDLAVFFGINKPTVWTDPAIVPGAIANGHTVVAGTGVDLAEDFNDAFSLVEEDDFSVNHVWAPLSTKGKLRGLRDANQNPIYVDGVRGDNNTATIYGEPITYSTNGGWDKTAAVAVVGDNSKAIIAVRQDVTVKVLTEATVGGINLAERDMIGLRFKFRVAYAVANPISAERDENAFPFAVVTPDLTPGA
jgi:HK97 family phage major capsid protein